MPVTITNIEILDLINANVKKLEEINKDQEEINKRIEELGKYNQQFVDLMNEEYGWGNWNNVDAKEYTFIPREEFEKAYYIVQNPAVKEKVETDDIQLTERKIMNDPELCEALDKLLEEQNAIEEIK